MVISKTNHYNKLIVISLSTYSDVLWNPATWTLRENEKQFLLASYRGRLKNLIYHVAVIFLVKEEEF